MFQKCFDKQAAIVFSIKYKEMFSQITESVTEESEVSVMMEEEGADDDSAYGDGGAESFRLSMLHSNREFASSMGADESEYRSDLLSSSTLTPSEIKS
jgi:hypothetical protein